MQDIVPLPSFPHAARALFRPSSGDPERADSIAFEAGWPHEGGLYTLSEAARLAQLRHCSARVWMGRAKGNMRYHELPPSIAVGFVRPANDRGRLLTFAELLTLCLVKGLRAEGFSCQTLRHVTAYTASRFASRTPLVMQRFCTEGARVLLELESARRAIACPDAPRPAPAPGEMEALQHFFAGILERALFRNVDWQNGAAARWWPMGRARSVLLDPMILGGAPHSAGTVCASADIAKAVWVARGDEAAVAATHDLSVQQVRDAVQFETDRPRIK